MNPNLTEIVCVLDRSGSMESLRDDAIGGFNTFLEGQKQGPGQARLTLVLFDDEYLLVHNAAPLASVRPLDRATFVPRGSTALLDAIGRSIEQVGARLAATPEADRPAKVIVAILTDGQENASTQYNKVQIAEMIRHQEKVYSWEFLFLAANQDAIATAAQMAIPAANAIAWQATERGTQEVYRKMSAEVLRRR